MEEEQDNWLSEHDIHEHGEEGEEKIMRKRSNSKGMRWIRMSKLLRYAREGTNNVL